MKLLNLKKLKETNFNKNLTISVKKFMITKRDSKLLKKNLLFWKLRKNMIIKIMFKKKLLKMLRFIDFKKKTNNSKKILNLLKNQPMKLSKLSLNLNLKLKLMKNYLEWKIIEENLTCLKVWMILL